MSQVPVSKFHSYGNDFILVSAGDLPESSYSAFARDVCEAHFGLGGDGCLFIQMRSETLFRIWQFNRDGSEFGMSGNGVRSAAAFARHKSLTRASRSDFETRSGLKRYELLEEKNGDTWSFRSFMGEPDFAPSVISTLSPDQEEVLDDYPLGLEDRTVQINGVWVGNPQCVLIVDHLPDEDEFHRLGASLEVHPFFPERTNVSFVRREDDKRVSVRIWERGVGPTFSSGTGSCGAAVTAIRKGIVRSPVEVATETGTQIVEWSPGEEIVLTGASVWIADAVFNWRPLHRA